MQQLLLPFTHITSCRNPCAFIAMTSISLQQINATASRRVLLLPCRHAAPSVLPYAVAFIVALPAAGSAAGGAAALSARLHYAVKLIEALPAAGSAAGGSSHDWHRCLTLSYSLLHCQLLAQRQAAQQPESA